MSLNDPINILSGQEPSVGPAVCWPWHGSNPTLPLHSNNNIMYCERVNSTKKFMLSGLIKIQTLDILIHVGHKRKENEYPI